MKTNLQELMDSLQINAAQFAEEIGVQRSSISHFLSGRNNPSLDVIRKILTAYPKVNADWLIFGEGEMFKQSASAEEDKILIQPTDELNLFATAQDEDPVPYGKNYPPKSTNSPANPHPKTSVQSTIEDAYSPEKGLERIVFFYKNGSFKEYLPQ